MSFRAKNGRLDRLKHRAGLAEKPWPTLFYEYSRWLYWRAIGADYPSPLEGVRPETRRRVEEVMEDRRGEPTAETLRRVEEDYRAALAGGPEELPGCFRNVLG